MGSASSTFQPLLLYQLIKVMVIEVFKVVLDIDCQLTMAATSCLADLPCVPHCSTDTPLERPIS